MWFNKQVLDSTWGDRKVRELESCPHSPTGNTDPSPGNWYLDCLSPSGSGAAQAWCLESEPSSTVLSPGSDECTVNISHFYHHDTLGSSPPCWQHSLELSSSFPLLIVLTEFREVNDLVTVTQPDHLSPSLSLFFISFLETPENWIFMGYVLTF